MDVLHLFPFVGQPGPRECTLDDNLLHLPWYTLTLVDYSNLLAEANV